MVLIVFAFISGFTFGGGSCMLLISNKPALHTPDDVEMGLLTEKVLLSMERLKHAAGDNRQTANELYRQTQALGLHIAKLCSDSQAPAKLPRGYFWQPAGERLWTKTPALSYGNSIYTSCEPEITGNFSPKNVTAYKQFAQDVSDGWLDELASFLADNSNADSKALEAIRTKMPF